MDKRFPIEDQIEMLASALRGRVVTPKDADYEALRQLAHTNYDARPAAVIRVANAADVAAVINFVQATDLPLAVRSGGHSAIGGSGCTGGIVMDLRDLTALDIDEAAKTAWVGSGLSAGEVSAAVTERKLIIGFGDSSTVGVGGLTLGGGIGYMARKHGLTIDNLLAAEIVTASGDILIVDAGNHSDLFWALRGGGGNFGVVTAFHFRLIRLPARLLGGMLVYPAEMAREVIRNFREVLPGAPDEIGSAISLTSAPDAPIFPEAVRGKAVVLVHLLYAGEYAAGEAATATIRAFGPPLADMVGPTSYVEHQGTTPLAPGYRNYWTADFYDSLPDEAVDILAAAAQDPISPSTNIFIAPGGGYASRIAEDATAFGERRAPFNIHYLASWPDAAFDAEGTRRIKAVSAAMKPWSTGRVYLNYIGNEGQTRIDNAFGPAKMARLRALKAKWDPDNFFRNNQNISPAAQG